MANKPISVVVTGATGHLGKAVVARLAEIKGARIIGVSRSGMRLLAGSRSRAIASGADLATARGASRLKACVEDEFRSRFAVVNCTGYFPGYKRFEEVGYREAEMVFRSNFLSVYFVALALVPLLAARGGGEFLSFSTLSGSEAFPLMAAFDSSKAALEQLTRHLANEYGGAGVQANVFALATLRTSDEIRMKPHGDHARWIEPQEVAELVQQVVSGKLPLVNGNVLRCYHYSDSFYRTSYLDRVQK